MAARQKIQTPAILIYYQDGILCQQFFEWHYDSGKNKSVDFKDLTFYCRHDESYHVHETKHYALVLVKDFEDLAKSELKDVIRDKLSNDVAQKEGWLMLAKQKLSNFNKLYPKESGVLMKKPRCHNCKHAGDQFKIGKLTHLHCKNPEKFPKEKWESGELTAWDSLCVFSDSCPDHEFKESSSQNILTKCK